MIRIPDHIKKLRPYKAGKPISELAREKGLTKIVKLASNENPLGPSPAAVAALAKAPTDWHRYVNPGSPELLAALAEKYNKRPDQLIAGGGSGSLLNCIVMAFTSENDEILTSEGTFIGIYVNANKLNRCLVKIPLKNYAYDLDRIAASVTAATRIIYLANPNNPTGSMITRSEFERFMTLVPDNILVVLDEAYAAYAADHDDYPDGLTYDYKNLLTVRTLSKVYGLAGLRVGFAAGPPELITELYKVRLPFEPNLLAQTTAIAALEDETFLKHTLTTNRQSLALLKAGFDKIGLSQVPTAANFIMIFLPSQELAHTFFEQCLERGLIVRHVDSFGVPDGVRISSGTKEETIFALEVIEKVYTEMSDKIEAQAEVQ